MRGIHCTKCYGPSSDKFTEANRMQLADIPPELDDLTFIEQMLIARVHPVVSMFRRHGRQTDYKGNVISFVQNIDTICNVLFPIFINWPFFYYVICDLNTTNHRYYATFDIAFNSDFAFHFQQHISSFQTCHWFGRLHVAEPQTPIKWSMSAISRWMDRLFPLCKKKDEEERATVTPPLSQVALFLYCLWFARLLSRARTKPKNSHKPLWTRIYRKWPPQRQRGWAWSL